ncbi:SDR family oxidoreductase [uncultured Shewanella sp.]|uniref:SDR family oxidoreductase n=1 Tax=uncultured Shewanella sp. TaxID=173975 RepID=UPI00262234A9|nr:SDR family oxidoreductase [uncultured Shewanella sp.]
MRQNILITGASSGLGRGMAIEFARKGRNLALCARRVDKLEELKHTLLKLNPNIKVVVKQLDVNEHSQVFDVFNECNEALLGLDRIIVNAGIGKGVTIGTGSFNINVQTAQTNFIAALAQAEAAMAIFRQQNAGHLVTISSFSALRGFRRALTVYAATKAALSSLTEGIRIDCLGTPINVTCVHPGFIRSEMNEKVKKVPFIVDTEAGCRAIVKGIEAEKATCFAPNWPWAWIHWLVRIMPARYLKHMS